MVRLPSETVRKVGYSGSAALDPIAVDKPLRLLRQFRLVHHGEIPPMTARGSRPRPAIRRHHKLTFRLAAPHRRSASRRPATDAAAPRNCPTKRPARPTSPRLKAHLDFP